MCQFFGALPPLPCVWVKQILQWVAVSGFLSVWFLFVFEATLPVLWGTHCYRSVCPTAQETRELVISTWMKRSNVTSSWFLVMNSGHKTLVTLISTRSSGRHEPEWQHWPHANPVIPRAENQPFAPGARKDFQCPGPVPCAARKTVGEAVSAQSGFVQPGIWAAATPRLSSGRRSVRCWYNKTGRWSGVETQWLTNVRRGCTNEDAVQSASRFASG